MPMDLIDAKLHDLQAQQRSNIMTESNRIEETRKIVEDVIKKAMQPLTKEIK